MRASEFTTDDLDLSHKPTKTGGVEIRAKKDQKEAGFVVFQRLDGNKVKAAFVWVPERLRRTGIGSAMYRYARNKLGLDIVPSDSQTDLGKKFWTQVHENIDIDQHLDGGDLEGYVTDTDKVNYRNYLESQGADQELIDHIGQKYDRIGILRNMYVDEDMRNQGIGNRLVGSAIDDAVELGAKAVILVADMAESNEIDLQKWYEGFGFTTIGQAGSDPVMLLEL